MKKFKTIRLDEKLVKRIEKVEKKWGMKMNSWSERVKWYSDLPRRYK